MNDHKRPSLIYLACPYSHENPAVRHDRFRKANLAAGALMRQGLYVFSPISQTHPIAEACSLPLGFDYWHEYDRAILSVCSALYILAIDGWDTSKGVLAEIKIAEEFRIPVLKFVDVGGNVLEGFEHAGAIRELETDLAIEQAHARRLREEVEKRR